MTEERKKQALLGAVVILLLAVFYFNFGGGKNSEWNRAGLEGSDAKTLLAALPQIPPVPWERLAEGATDYNPKGRNLFKFGYIPPPPPSAEDLAAMERARKAEAEARRKQQEQRMRTQENRQKRFMEQQKNQPAKAAPPPQKVTQTPGPPPAPEVPFKFIGYLGPAEGKIAVLVDGEDFYLGREGEPLGEDFRIVEIGYEWVRIGYTDPRFVNQTRRIAMGE